MGKLDGKIALITGGARGQGETTGRLFAAEGATVVLADLLDAEGAAVARDIGSSGFYRHLDISDEGQWKDLVQRTRQQFGTIDVLINNAGIVWAQGILEIEVTDFRRVLDVNLIGSWLGIKTVAPVMLAHGAGSIVNIASSAGLFGLNGLGAYASSKWGLRGLSKVAALELGYRGVRVNSIYPGGISTVMGNPTNASEEEVNKHYLAQPLQRIGRPEEVARVSLFLASSDSSYLCGAEIAVDGGQTAGAYVDFLPGAPSDLG